MSKWFSVRALSIAAGLAVIFFVGYGLLPKSNEKGYWQVVVDGLDGDNQPILRRVWIEAGRPPLQVDWRTRQSLHADTDEAKAAESIVAQEKINSSFPAFRNRDRTGMVAGIHLETDWKKHPPVERWRMAVGAGWSAFAVQDAVAVTQEQRGDRECVVAYSLDQGKQIWIHEDKCCFFEFSGGGGPRATPTIEGNTVFSLGATGILNAINLTNGDRLWSADILRDADAENRLFGMAGSPLVLDDLVIVAPGGEKGSLAGYARATGKLVWQAGSADASYSSPQLFEIAGEKVVLIFNGDGVDAHAPSTGELLWNIPWVTNFPEKNNVCQPIVIPVDNANAKLFIASAYDQGSALFEVSRTGKSWNIRLRWKTRSLKAKFASATIKDQYVYGLDDGILVCVSLDDGKQVWKGGRYRHGQLLLVGDVLLVQSEQGDVVLVEASPKRFLELSRLEALHHRTWNHPALAGNSLLVRNDREAACFSLKLKSP